MNLNMNELLTSGSCTVCNACENVRFVAEADSGFSALADGSAFVAIFCSGSVINVVVVVVESKLRGVDKTTWKGSVTGTCKRAYLLLYLADLSGKERINATKADAAECGQTDYTMYCIPIPKLTANSG